MDKKSTDTARIPKTIHYCWLSGEKMPKDAVKCMDSWRKHMPDYELVLWNMNRFDINSHVFVKEACEAGKWASASDYIRLYALYNEGGIYLDTDVYVKKSFDRFLDDGFFTAVEYHENLTRPDLDLLNDDGTPKNRAAGIFTHGIQLQAAVMGAVKGHPFLKSCMEWYDGRRFTMENGKPYHEVLVSPQVYADVAVDYGFRYKNELQELERGMTIYPNTVFPGGQSHMTEESCAVHLCHGSWRSLGGKVMHRIRQNNFLRAIIGKKKIKKKF